MPDWGLALSHAAVAGTSIYCLVNVRGDKYFFVRSTFGIIALNSLFGFYKTVAEDGKLDDTYKTSNFITKVFSSPGICASLYHYCKYGFPIALLHYALPIVALCQYINDKEDDRIVDTANAVNAISMCYISFVDENYMGLYASICHALNSFVLVKEIEDVPPDILRNIGLVFYSLFALHATNLTSVSMHY